MLVHHCARYITNKDFEVSSSDILVMHKLEDPAKGENFNIAGGFET
jgi:hypothetical protein